MAPIRGESIVRATNKRAENPAGCFMGHNGLGEKENLDSGQHWFHRHADA